MTSKKNSSVDPTLIRVLDANYNRAKEALRVTEDIARFVIEDKALTQSVKRSRHRITQIFLELPITYRQLLLSRDAQNDLGKASVIFDKKKGVKVIDIAASNLQRGEEAVRVLEEITKLIKPSCSREFQKLRFNLYGLEKRILSKL